MKKKLYIILILLLCLLIIIYFLLQKKGWNTTKADDNMFSVKDTAAVTAIFMANKKGKKVLLQRKPFGWQVNGKPADEIKVNLLLKTLHDVKVQKPVEKGGLNTVIGILATHGIKTEIYAGEKLIKTIYVGSETPDQTGTLMLLEGEKEPYVAHIPGFVGYLTPRFVVDEIKLKSRLVFNYKPSDISSVTVLYPQLPSESFKIYNNLLYNAANVLVKPTDSKMIDFYLNGFSNLYLEGYLSDIQKNETDSIVKQMPYAIVTVKDINNVEKKLTVYLKSVGKRTKERFNPQTNEAYAYDTEKYFAVLNNDSVLAIIQQYNFGKVLLKLSNFNGVRINQ